jgi:hypothetical protein
LAARYRDPEIDRGNLTPSLEPGELVEYAPPQTLHGEPILDVIPGRSYTWDAELERHRVDHFFPRSDPPPRRAPAFNHRSLRRG